MIVLTYDKKKKKHVFKGNFDFEQRLVIDQYLNDAYFECRFKHKVRLSNMSYSEANKLIDELADKLKKDFLKFAKSKKNKR
jgi:hypothetical protein